MENLTILLRLLFAHFLADFALQTDRMSLGKKGSNANQRLSKYGYQFIHSLIHAVAAYVLVAQWDNWIIPLVVFVSHFLIDSIKSTCKKQDAKIYLADQLAHLSVLFILWLCLFARQSAVYLWLTDCFVSIRFWAILTAYVLILQPTSIFLGLFIKRWTPDQDSNFVTLPNAGKWIGYLERFLILTFVLTGNIEGVGFLLAAKSIFRFGELSKPSEIRITEYVMIGTLTSFAITLIVGFALVYFSHNFC